MTQPGITFRCKVCKHTCSCDVSSAGKTGRCSRCRNPTPIPSARQCWELLLTDWGLGEGARTFIELFPLLATTYTEEAILDARKTLGCFREWFLNVHQYFPGISWKYEVLPQKAPAGKPSGCIDDFIRCTGNQVLIVIMNDLYDEKRDDGPSGIEESGTRIQPFVQKKWPDLPVIILEHLAFHYRYDDGPSVQCGEEVRLSGARIYCCYKCGPDLYLLRKKYDGLHY